MLSATSSWQLEYQGAAPSELSLNNKIEFRWNGTTILTGLVDMYAFGDRPGEAGRVRGGRSITCDMLDSSAALAKGSVVNSTIGQIAKLLAAPYNIDVVVNVPPGQDEAIRRYRVEPGERCIEALRRLADPRQMLVWTRDDGALIMSRATKAAPLGVLTRDSFKSVSGRVDVAQRFKHYVVLGQSFANDAWSEIDAAHAKGTATDPLFVARERRLVMIAKRQTNKSRAAAQATWERQVRAGRSYSYTAQVDGWEASGTGSVWTPDTTWRIRDSENGIDFDHLLTDVSLRATASEESASLTFSYPQAFVGTDAPGIVDGVS